MEARQYFEKEYGHDHIELVIEMKDFVSLYGLMDEFAEWKVKNCSIPNVVGSYSQEEIEEAYDKGLEDGYACMPSHI